MDTISIEYIDSLDNNREKTVTFSSYLIKEPFKKESLFVSQVNGQSMQPKIMHESLVIADLSKKEIEDASIYLLHYDNNMWIKQASYNKHKEDYEFISLNPDYAHLVYERKEVHVIAKVLLTFTAL